jgi:hypothetical protein
MVEQRPQNTDILIQTPAALIREICRSIADAQRELDSLAINAQDNLEKEHPELHEIGYQVSWYSIPEVNVELKVAMHFDYKEEKTPEVLLGAYNAKYKQISNFMEEGSSTLKLRLVSIPPPVRINETQR